MDAEISAPEITSESPTKYPGSSFTTSYLASNDDDSKLETSSANDFSLKFNENSETNVVDDDNVKGKLETVHEVISTMQDVSDAPLVSSDGSNSISKDESLRGGDNGLEEFRGEGSIEKFDIESVGNGKNEEEIQMGSIGVGDQSVLSMESGEEGRIGVDENYAVLDIGVKVFDPVVVDSVYYKAIEVDGSKFFGKEELAVDATPLNGDGLGIKEYAIKEREVVPVAGNASLDNGFNHVSDPTSTRLWVF